MFNLFSREKKAVGRVLIKQGKRGNWWWQLYEDDTLVAIAPINNKNKTAAEALQDAQRVSNIRWGISDEDALRLSQQVDPEHNN